MYGYCLCFAISIYEVHEELNPKSVYVFAWDVLMYQKYPLLSSIVKKYIKIYHICKTDTFVLLTT